MPGDGEPKLCWIRRDVEDPADFYWRNEHTWRSACFRGDTYAFLNATFAGERPFLRDPDTIRRLRFDPNHHIAHNQAIPFWDPDLGPVPSTTLKALSPAKIKNIEAGTAATTRIRGFKLRLKRVLAQGGFGAATLWQASFADGHREDVVIKIALDDDTDLSEEREWHWRYNEADHIVQARDLAEMAEEHQGPNPTPRAKTPHFDCKGANISVLEHMSHGNLSDMLKRIAWLKEPFPNNALWQLWGCLVEGVAEVAYQHGFLMSQQEKGFSELWRQAEAEGAEAVETFLTYLETREISHDVHFDLEENNILVSQDEEGNMIFKLHDFGHPWSQEMRESWEWWPASNYWTARKPVKDYRYLPEQHVREWDHIEFPDHIGPGRFTGEDFNHPHKTRIAGRYGSWSNVFIIARTMECAITMIEMAHPFKAKNLPEEDPAKTYGWRLEPYMYENRNLDRQLIATILRCMREFPEDRDSIIQLLRQLSQAKREGKLDNDDETREFWKQATSPMSELLAQDLGVPDENNDHGGDDDFNPGGGKPAEGRGDNLPGGPKGGGAGGGGTLKRKHGDIKTRGEPTRRFKAINGRVAKINKETKPPTDKPWRSGDKYAGQLTQAGPIAIQNLRHRGRVLTREHEEDRQAQLRLEREVAAANACAAQKIS